MKKTIQQLKPYQPEEPLAQMQQRLKLPRLVRLSANENPYGTSKKVTDLFSSGSFVSENRYPDGQAQDLRAAVSKKLAVQPDQLVFGCGLDEIIALINRTFLTDGDEVLINSPTFSEYQINAQIEGAIPVAVPVLQTGKIDFNKLVSSVNSKTKLIWLCNPNNPTGTYETVAAIEQLMQQVPADVIVVVDEAYIEYVTKVANPSALRLLDRFENLVVLRTFSKAYGLANLRVGFGVFSIRLAQYMQTVRLPYNLNSVSQTAAIVALQDQDFIQQTIAKTVQERELWETFLQDNHIFYYPSQTNFIFIKVTNAAAISADLLAHGFLVRDGLADNWLRITIGEPGDNRQVRQLLADKINVN